MNRIFSHVLYKRQGESLSFQLSTTRNVMKVQYNRKFALQTLDDKSGAIIDAFIIPPYKILIPIFHFFTGAQPS